MSELSVAVEPANRDLTESGARGRASWGSFLRRRRAPLLAVTALCASVALGWVTSARFGSDPGSAATEARLARPSAVHRGAALAVPESRDKAFDRPGRAVSAPLAQGLFATHSWHVDPPPPPPPPPMAPAPPTAPPFPYVFLGAYTQGGDTVYFLSREDRVIDAHVGDHLDGSYVFESADSGALVFNYMPLNIRQSIPTTKP